MYKVIATAANGYVGFSRKMAFQYARACQSSGRSFLVMKRYGPSWRDVAEIVA